MALYHHTVKYSTVQRSGVQYNIAVQCRAVRLAATMFDAMGLTLLPVACPALQLTYTCSALQQQPWAAAATAQQQQVAVVLLPLPWAAATPSPAAAAVMVLLLALPALPCAQGLLPLPLLLLLAAAVDTRVTPYPT